jgi:Flp pilus assembly pilin Flp
VVVRQRAATRQAVEYRFPISAPVWLGQSRSQRRAYCDASTYRRSTEVKFASGRALARGKQAGQGLAEYALILALIAVASIVAITFMGGSINDMLSDLGNRM